MNDTNTINPNTPADGAQNGDAERLDTLVTDIALTKHEGSEIEITGEIPVSTATAFEEHALKRMQKTVEIPGFRKGHVPLPTIRERVDQNELLREIAEDVLSEAYPLLVTTHQLDVIGRPGIALTKLAAGNPIGFKIRTAVMPEIGLPDYKAIAQKEQATPIPPTELEVTDADLQDVIDNVRQREAHASWHAANPDHEGHDHAEIPKEEWPELTDEMVQKLGDFKDLEDFKTKIRANLAKEKEFRAKEAKRGKLVEALIAATTIDVPEVFIQSELENMTNEFKGQLSRMGLTFEGYLAHANKTEDAVRDEWRSDAEKRAKLQLILNKISEVESITAPEEIVENEVKNLMEHYPDADESRARAYVESVETNRKVFAFLERTPEESSDTTTA